MKFANIIVGSLIISFCFSMLAYPSDKVKQTINSKFNESNQKRPYLASENGGGYIMNIGASYSWEDITSTGTLLVSLSNADSNEQTVILPWDIKFYGTNYTEIYITVDGWISFTYEDYASSGDIPDYYEENVDCVAIFWTDLNTQESMGGSGAIYYRTLSNPSRFVVEYYNISYDYEYFDEELDDWVETSQNLGSFEVIFYQSGPIIFQYQYLKTVSLDDYVSIGLDHGDLINYNLYDGITQDALPISSMAIGFTFNQMSGGDFSVKFEKEDELAWKVVEFDNTKMEFAFGSNWKNDFGLLSNIDVDKKTKIKVSSITNNANNWDINYELWNWADIDDDFEDNSENDNTLSYLKKPKEYLIPHNLTNLFPFLLPGPSLAYLFNANLSDFYDDLDSNDEGCNLEYNDYIPSQDADIECDAIYNSLGLLISISIVYYDNMNEEESTIYQLERCFPSNADYRGESNLILEFFTTPIVWIVIAGISAAVGGIAIAVVVKRKKSTGGYRKAKKHEGKEKKSTKTETTSKEETFADQAPTTNKCTKCGWVKSSAASKCPRCGFSLSTTSTTPTEEAEDKIVVESKTPEPSPSSYAIASDTNDEIQKINNNIAKLYQDLENLNHKYYIDSQISEAEYLKQKNDMFEKLGELQGQLSILQEKQ